MWRKLSYGFDNLANFVQNIADAVYWFLRDCADYCWSRSEDELTS